MKTVTRFSPDTIAQVVDSRTVSGGRTIRALDAQLAISQFTKKDTRALLVRVMISFVAIPLKHMLPTSDRIWVIFLTKLHLDMNSNMRNRTSIFNKTENSSPLLQKSLWANSTTDTNQVQAILKLGYRNLLIIILAVLSWVPTLLKTILP